MLEIKDLPLFETIDIAIDAAAEYLPEGYRVVIKVEKHGYGVYLEDEKGSEVSVDGGDGMRSDIWEAVQIANGEEGE